jgi:hypothetical protein
MKRLILMIISALICAAVFTSCKDGQAIDPKAEMNKEQIRQIKKKAVNTLTIGSNTLVLEAYLWRDFMPGNTQNGLISINWLIDAKSVKIPNDINMVKQYVIYKDLVWIADYENETPTPDLPEYKKEKISRNGPEWETDIYVNVIAQIHDYRTNKDYYIKLENVKITHTS